MPLVPSATQIFLTVSLRPPNSPAHAATRAGHREGPGRNPLMAATPKHRKVRAVIDVDRPEVTVAGERGPGASSFRRKGRASQKIQAEDNSHGMPPSELAAAAGFSPLEPSQLGRLSPPFCPSESKWRQKRQLFRCVDSPMWRQHGFPVAECSHFVN